MLTHLSTLVAQSGISSAAIRVQEGIPDALPFIEPGLDQVLDRAASVGGQPSAGS